MFNLKNFYIEHKTISISDCVYPGAPVSIDQDEFELLMKSIEEIGVLHPISVCHARPYLNGKWEILSGFRRMLASSELGIKTIDALVVTKYLSFEEKKMIELFKSSTKVNMSVEDIQIAIKDICLEFKTGDLSKDIKLCAEKTGLPQNIVKKVMNETERYKNE